jgi:hypothetical protein
VRSSHGVEFCDDAFRQHQRRRRDVFAGMYERRCAGNRQDTGFVLGSAVKHPYDLVTGHYSVHTTVDALRQGESNIAAIGRRLHNQGVLGPKERVPGLEKSNTTRLDGGRR